jgi:hypothetical protein
LEALLKNFGASTHQVFPLADKQRTGVGRQNDCDDTDYNTTLGAYYAIKNPSQCSTSSGLAPSQLQV